MLSRIFFTKFFILVSVAVAFAQGEMEFKEESFDFGNVTEGSIASHEFEFTNKGNEPIVISNVQASCGCTTPFWTKDPIKPGGKGIIKASYNSSGRPGAFTKTVTVTSNAHTSSRFLTIKGVVNAKPLVSPSAQVTFGGMLFDLGKVVKGRRVEKSITVLNSGDAPLSFIAMESGCKCVTYKSLPTSIKPGEKAQIELIYTPRQTGTFNEPLTFTTNDKNVSESKLFLKAQVEEDTSLNSVVKESKSSIPFN